MKKLKKYMDRLGISPEDMATRITVKGGKRLSRQSVYNYLNNKTKDFRYDNKRLVVDVLNDKRDELIRGGSKASTLPPIATIDGVFNDES